MACPTVSLKRNVIHYRSPYITEPSMLSKFPLIVLVQLETLLHFLHRISSSHAIEYGFCRYLTDTGQYVKSFNVSRSYGQVFFTCTDIRPRFAPFLCMIKQFAQLEKFFIMFEPNSQPPSLYHRRKNTRMPFAICLFTIGSLGDNGTDISSSATTLI